MKKRLFSILMALTLAVAVPASTFAASDEEEDVVDARLKGYKEGPMNMKDASGTGLTWFLLVVLGGMSIGVMFINPKRSHLD